MDEVASRVVAHAAAAYRPLRVCHIASGDRWDGAEVQVATLLRHLARDPRVRLLAIVLNTGRLAEELARLGVEVKVIPENQLGFFGILRRATAFLRGTKIDVIHSHRYKENLLAAWLASRLGVPVLIRTQHGSPEPQSGLKGLKQKLTLGVDRVTGRWASARVIAVSEDLSRRLGPVFGPHRVMMIPNGVDLGQVKSDLSVAEAKQRLGIPADYLVLGTASRLEPVKRLDIFLQAAQRIGHKNQKARFVIAGEGGERAALEALARNLGLGERVRFLGHRDDAYDVLRAFDILVLSSDHEGLPMILLEAMALGAVVVARAVGGIPEVIRDGVNGVLVNSSDAARLADACLGLMDDPSRRRTLAEVAAATLAQHYTAERTANQVIELYLSSLSPQ